VIPDLKPFTPALRDGGVNGGTLTQGSTLGYFHLLPDGRRKNPACGVGFVISRSENPDLGYPPLTKKAKCVTIYI
jgi:hypothetical protein